MARNSGSLAGAAATVLGRLVFCALAIVLLLPFGQAFADDEAKLFATTENGFGRIIIDFPARLDLPTYRVHSENGVLTVEFDKPVTFTLPDVAAALPDYVTVSRIDSDRRALRLALRSAFTVNHIEAGEQLFIDLMPTTWQGLPPQLPPEVVANLAERAKQAAIRAEQARKAEQARILHPVAALRVGRNPTFMRIEFTWNTDTEAKFAFDGKTGNLDFDWPVPVDVSPLVTGLPKEVASVTNQVTTAGSRVAIHINGKVVPRYYALSSRDFIVDIDTASSVPADPSPVAAATAKAYAAALASTSTDGKKTAAARVTAWADPALVVVSVVPQPPITPQIAVQGGTVRVTFPFDRDTPAAVFRRGDVVWMLFDTMTGINQPTLSPALASFASSFAVVPAGDSQVVRIDLASDKLATLGSEGRAWVLSLGDMQLGPTEPVTLSKSLDASGSYHVNVDLARPGKVHRFADPVVGDTLTVVTAFPPARGVVHDLDYVDFDALRSVHGLVIKPLHPEVNVGIVGKEAVISTPGGLIVSPPNDVPVVAADAKDATSRSGFIDLGSLKEDNPVAFNARTEQLTATASKADGPARDAARLQLARFYLANDYAYEAIGVLGVLQAELKTDAMRSGSQLMLGAADVLAARPADALQIFNSKAFGDDIDAKFWRSQAETDSNDYPSARRDVIASLPIIGSYPQWLRTRFLLSGVRAALETGDTALAEQLYKAIEFAGLEPEQQTLYQLLAGRIAEAEGRVDEALDTYGQVIAADVRPTRAEAVYRTILILNQAGRVDPAKATKTLAAEAMLWRGNALEASMDKLLAELYFRNGDYRLGFETAKQTLAYFPSTADTDALGTEAQSQFQELYLNGKADSLPPVEALSLYYDFRTLTPPGSNGDEMIRNLAQRLVKADLLGQAAQLLKYQVDNRLSGAAQAQVANELAVIDIANRDPQGALSVLNATQLAELPPSIDRQRRLIEARALIDSQRTDLALDILTPLTGRDADLLRVEANWNARNYEAAGKQLELTYGPDAAGTSGPGLTTGGRMDIVRAAVAFALAGDKPGLARLRSEFSDVLAKGPEWPMFDYVTSAIEPVTSTDFAKVSRAVAGIDSLDAFLASYKQVYGSEAPMTPDSAAAADGSTPIAAAAAPAGTAG